MAPEARFRILISDIKEEVADFTILE
jgi:hypothetical protein